MATILDQHGKPIERREPARRVAATVRRQREIRAGFDASRSKPEYPAALAEMRVACFVGGRTGPVLA